MEPFASAWGAFRATQDVGVPWGKTGMPHAGGGAEYPRCALARSPSAISVCVPVSTPVNCICRLYYQVANTNPQDTYKTENIAEMKRMGWDNANNPCTTYPKKMQRCQPDSQGFVSCELKTMINESDLTGVTKKCTEIIYRLFETMGLCPLLILNLS